MISTDRHFLSSSAQASLLVPEELERSGTRHPLLPFASPARPKPHPSQPIASCTPSSTFRAEQLSLGHLISAVAVVLGALREPADYSAATSVWSTGGIAFPRPPSTDLLLPK